jgi:transcriptional regulator of heat shock response
MLDARKELILKLLIEDYIRSAQPVGSKQLGERHALGVSPATVRGDMATLEDEGFLRAPHTSSGRVPTEKAYVYYLQRLRNKKVVLPPAAREELDHSTNDTQSALKTIAKKLVEMSGETALIAVDPSWSFYAGVGNLLQKPDFQNLEVLQSISVLIDQFDDVIHQMYSSLPDEPQVFIGSHNPFGEQMTAIIVRYRLGGGHDGILGLVGPLRMDYSKNLALVEWAKEAIDEI